MNTIQFKFYLFMRTMEEYMDKIFTFKEIYDAYCQKCEKNNDDKWSRQKVTIEKEDFVRMFNQYYDAGFITKVESSLENTIYAFGFDVLKNLGLGERKRKIMEAAIMSFNDRPFNTADLIILCKKLEEKYGIIFERKKMLDLFDELAESGRFDFEELEDGSIAFQILPEYLEKKETITR